MEDNFIIGKVIKIIDEYTILINAGYKNNSDLEDFMESTDSLTIEIYEPGFDVIDPETNEKLGQYDYIKDTVIIERIYENYSVCKKISADSATSGILALSPLFSKQKKINYEKINIDINDINYNLSPKSTAVCVGDLVRLAN